MCRFPQAVTCKSLLVETARTGVSSSFPGNQSIIEISDADIAALQREARATQRLRARICLHADLENPIHDMVIALCQGTYIRPHRHIGKSETFHSILGSFDVIFFGDDGQVIRKVEMGPFGSGRTSVYRLSAALWHTVIVHGDIAVFHELTNGPFRPDGSEFASWAPVEGDAHGIEQFMQRISSQK